jgi:superkiller protein 3
MTPNPERTPNIPKGRCVFFALICAFVIGVFAWSAEPGALELVSSRAQDAYYNLLVQGFQSGQLNVKREPAPGLTKLSNPYDPAANAPYVWDVRHLAYEMSYYKGKLYLYFGVTPALVLFWPYAILTGHYLEHKDAAVIFFAVGFIVAAGLLRAIWRRYFTEANVWPVAAGILALGLGSGILEMLASCDVYEVAKACAFAFTLLALDAIWSALRDPKQQIKYLALASLAYGLAIGSRPSLLFGAIILLVPVARAWCAGGANLRWRTGLLFIAASVPVTLIVSGLMLYNYLRFDSPFEFGWHYQLTSFQNHGARQFSFSYLWYNFRFYFLQPMHWTGQFPFLSPVQILPLPVGYNGTEAGYSGILTNYPIVWLALAVPLAWKGRVVEELSDLRWFALATFLFFLTSIGTLCLFFASGNGYESDFLPELLLLAAIGILGAERAVAGLHVWRHVVRCGWSLLLVFTITVNCLASVEAHAISHYLDGDFFIHEGRLADASGQYQKALAIWPEYSGARCGLGSVFLQQGQINEAIAQYQKALEFDPSMPEALNNLGYCYLKTGQMNDAIAQYQKVLEIEPDFPQARNNLAFCLLQVDRTDDAIVQYQKAVDLAPESATYHCGLGNALLQKGQVNEAAAQYQKALEINPDFAEAHYYLGYCLVQTGQMADAIVQYRKAVELEPKSAAFHRDFGNVLLQKGDADGAIPEYQKALALEPKSADVCKRLGDALFQKGQLNDAIGQYQNALEINPNFPEALNNLGYCFLQAGQVDDAIIQFRKIIELEPDFAQAYDNLGGAYRKKSMPAEAVANYEKALELQPQFMSAQKNLAWLLATWPDASIRNGKKAVSLAEQANQLSDGQDPEILRTLAAAYAEAGRFDEAVSTAQKAVTLAQSDTILTGELRKEIGLYQNHSPCRSKDN